MGDEPHGTGAISREDRAAIDAALSAYCDEFLPAAGDAVGDAVRYSLAGGGKRMRATLVLAAYRGAGGTGDARALAAAVEVVHAYSLVHDDLPCMDDDDVRRGRPTVHRAFDVPVATAAGLTMVPFALRCGLRATRALGLSADVQSRVLGELFVASGPGGMIGGQLLDLAGEGKRLALEDLEQIHRRKTGMLIAASLRIGAIAACASPAIVDALTRYGESLGLAFQIADDVLDVTATSDVLGKTAGKDSASRKSTYPSLLGVEQAVALARRLAEEGRASLRAVNMETPELAHLSRYIVERRS